MTKGKSIIASLGLLGGAGFCLALTLGYRYIFFRIMDVTENPDAIPDKDLILQAPTVFGFFCVGLFVLIAIIVPLKAFLSKTKE